MFKRRFWISKVWSGDAAFSNWFLSDADAAGLGPHFEQQDWHVKLRINEKLRSPLNSDKKVTYPSKLSGIEMCSAFWVSEFYLKY